MERRIPGGAQFPFTGMAATVDAVPRSGNATIEHAMTALQCAGGS